MQTPVGGFGEDLFEEVLEGAPEVWEDLSDGGRREGGALSEGRGG